MRRIVELLVASVIISLMLNLMNAIDSGDTLEAISFVLGNISYRNITSFIITTTIWIIPQMLLFVFLGDYFETTLIKMFSCVRTRINNSGHMILRNFLKVCGWTGLFYASMILITIAYVFLREGTLHISLDVLIAYVACMISYYSFILIFQNVLSLAFGVAKSIAAVISLETVFLYLSDTRAGLAAWIPSCWVTNLSGHNFEFVSLCCETVCLIILIVALLYLCKLMIYRKEDI